MCLILLFKCDIRYWDILIKLQTLSLKKYLVKSQIIKLKWKYMKSICSIVFKYSVWQCCTYLIYNPKFCIMKMYMHVVCVTVEGPLKNNIYFSGKNCDVLRVFRVATRVAVQLNLSNDWNNMLMTIRNEKCRNSLWNSQKHTVKLIEVRLCSC